ncbi:MAG: BatD family protein [Porticoccaceae bacterium]|nr:BatD family protein [Porticoccaceae bacterium]
MSRPFKNKILTIFLIFMALPSWASLISKVDRTEIEADETLQLTVTYSGQSATGEPNFNQLQRDFEIISNSRQQQFSWINGEQTSSTNWTIVLMPKRQGQLNIPALSFKGDRTKAIRVLVRAINSATTAAGNKPVYIQTSVDKSSVYLQEQVILTHRLHYSVPLQDISISEFDIPDADIQQISEERFNKRINGRNYSIIDIKFAVFPQAVGKLTIPSQRFTAFETSGSQFGGFFSRGNRLARLTEEKTIDIMPRPNHISASQWMPSSQITLEESWSDNSDSLTAGEPITRTIKISALGLTAAQIQPLPSIENTALKLYPDQAALEDKQTNRGILGIRSESLAIVPSQEGKLTLPAIEIKWWDTVNHRMQTSRLPSRTFTVMAAKNTPQISYGNNPASQQIIDSEKPVNSPTFSRLTSWSLTINALLIAVIVGLLYWRRNTQPRPVAKEITKLPNTKQRLNQIAKQAADNNVATMRDTILLWGTEVFPQQPPRSLNQLADLMANPDLKQQFALLDQGLFKTDGNEPTAVDTTTILKQIKAYKPEKNIGKDRGTELKSLYPDYKS